MAGVSKPLLVHHKLIFPIDRRTETNKVHVSIQKALTPLPPFRTPAAASARPIALTTIVLTLSCHGTDTSFSPFPANAYLLCSLPAHHPPAAYSLCHSSSPVPPPPFKQRQKILSRTFPSSVFTPTHHRPSASPCPVRLSTVFFSLRNTSRPPSPVHPSYSLLLLVNCASLDESPFGSTAYRYLDCLRLFDEPATPSIPPTVNTVLEAIWQFTVQEV